MQPNLFDSTLSDAMSRDAAMERGLLVQLDATRWVRIDRRGVYTLRKNFIKSGVTTHEERIASLPMLPMAVYMFQGEMFVHVLYGTTRNEVMSDIIRLDVILSPARHVRAIADLSYRGYHISDQWPALAQTLNQVMRVTNQEGTLPLHDVTPREWMTQGDYLVQRPSGLRVLPGKRRTKQEANEPNWHPQLVRIK